MTQIDDILEQAKSMIPEANVAILAREVERLRVENEALQSVAKTGRSWLDFAQAWTSPTPEEEGLQREFAKSLRKLNAAMVNKALAA